MFNESFIRYTELSQADNELLDDIVDQFKGLFQGQNYRVEPLIRIGDGQIMSEIDKAVKEKGELSILEVGAGASYARSSAHNSPWLSRLISAKYKEQVEVIASDAKNNQNDGYSHIIISPDKTIVRPEYSNKLPSFFDHKHIIPVKEKDGVCEYIRPHIDPTIEQALYRLHFIENLEFTKLGETFPRGMFDIVMARHLGDDMLLREAVQYAEPALKKDGKFLAAGEFDKVWYKGHNVRKVYQSNRLVG